MLCPICKLGKIDCSSDQKNIECSNCNSLEQDRALYLFLCNIKDTRLKILIINPQWSMQNNPFKKQHEIHIGRVNKQGKLGFYNGSSNISPNNENYDLIIFSSVVELITDNLSNIFKFFQQILKPNGSIISLFDVRKIPRYLDRRTQTNFSAEEETILGNKNRVFSTQNFAQVLNLFWNTILEVKKPNFEVNEIDLKINKTSVVEFDNKTIFILSKSKSADTFSSQINIMNLLKSDVSNISYDFKDPKESLSWLIKSKNFQLAFEVFKKNNSKLGVDKTLQLLGIRLFREIGLYKNSLELGLDAIKKGVGDGLIKEIYLTLTANLDADDIDIYLEKFSDICKEKGLNNFYFKKPELAWLIEKRKFEKAEHILDTTVNNTDSSIEAYIDGVLLLIIIYTKTSRFERALNESKKLYELFSNNFSVVKNYIEILITTKKHHEAERIASYHLATNEFSKAKINEIKSLFIETLIEQKKFQEAATTTFSISTPSNLGKRHRINLKRLNTFLNNKISTSNFSHLANPKIAILTRIHIGEAPYIQSFISHHLEMGVDRFIFLIDRESLSNEILRAELLSFNIDTQIIDYDRSSIKTLHMSMFWELEEVRAACANFYVFNIDADEYLSTNSTSVTLSSIIENSHHQTLQIPWILSSADKNNIKHDRGLLCPQNKSCFFANVTSFITEHQSYNKSSKKPRINGSGLGLNLHHYWGRSFKDTLIRLFHSKGLISGFRRNNVNLDHVIKNIVDNEVLPDRLKVHAWVCKFANQQNNQDFISENINTNIEDHLLTKIDKSVITKIEDLYTDYKQNQLAQHYNSIYPHKTIEMGSINLFLP